MSGNSMFFRMHRLLDIYFVGGFGTVQFIDVDEYKGTRPDAIVMDHPHQTLQARTFATVLLALVPTGVISVRDKA